MSASRPNIHTLILSNVLVLYFGSCLLGPFVFPAYHGGGPSSTSGTRNHMQACLALMHVYAADNDGRIPPSYMWQDAVERYDTRSRFYTYLTGRNRVCPPFYFAANRTTLTKPFIKAPETDQLVLLFESRSRFRNTVGSYEILPRPSKNRNRVVIGNLDGSSRVLKLPEEVNISIADKHW